MANSDFSLLAPNTRARYTTLYRGYVKWCQARRHRVDSIIAANEHCRELTPREAQTLWSALKYLQGDVFDVDEEAPLAEGDVISVPISRTATHYDVPLPGAKCRGFLARRTLGAVIASFEKSTGVRILFQDELRVPVDEGLSLEEAFPLEDGGSVIVRFRVLPDALTVP